MLLTFSSRLKYVVNDKNEMLPYHYYYFYSTKIFKFFYFVRLILLAAINSAEVLFVMDGRTDGRRPFINFESTQIN
jgi:hypothetical protein